MRKIPTLFKRDFTQPGNPLTQEYNDGTEWVLAGEGVATRKYDGQSVLIRDHHMYKRYEFKDGKTPPTDFEEADYDATTGKHVGWVQVGWGSEDKYFREGLQFTHNTDPDNVNLADGTYELVGPKVQGNPEHYEYHQLIKHANAEEYKDVPTEFGALREWLTDKDIEGIVWHHPDGRMVKIKKKDFRLKRTVSNER
jgi:hypothetical protein